MSCGASAAENEPIESERNTLRLQGSSAHGDAALSVAFAPGGNTILSGGSSGTTKVWDAGVNTDTHPNLVQI